MSDREPSDTFELVTALERWWAGLDDARRHAAERVVRGGGYLTQEVSLSLISAGVPVLMPDDVRVWVKQQSLGQARGHRRD